MRRVVIALVLVLLAASPALACGWRLYAMVQDASAPWPGYWWKPIETLPNPEACRKKVLEATGRPRIHLIGWYPISKTDPDHPAWVKKAVALSGEHALFVGCLPADYDPYEKE